jgi:hypothetical protein
MQSTAIQLSVISVISGIVRVTFGGGPSYRRSKLQVNGWKSGRQIGVVNGIGGP